MKQLIRVLFNFLHIRFCELQKSIGNNTMKKMLLATALALLITGCAQQTFTVQNKPAAVAISETITHHFLFWNWAEENCRCSQNLYTQKMLVVAKPSANIRKWIARFYYFRHLYSAGSACVLLTH